MLDRTPDTIPRAQGTGVTAELHPVKFVEYPEGVEIDEDQAIANPYLQAEFGCDLSKGVGKCYNTITRLKISRQSMNKGLLFALFVVFSAHNQEIYPNALPGAAARAQQVMDSFVVLHKCTQFDADQRKQPHTKLADFHSAAFTVKGKPFLR